MPEMTFAEATCRALADEMRRDSDVWALGEDLGYGGIFGQYRGLADEFGAHRIVSTPISEACIMGAGLGAALVGTRPVIEMRIADFALAAFDELINQIAKVRYMLGGQARASVVVRMPHGIFRNSAAQHSQNLEAWLAHMPGLVVLAPGTAADAAALLKAAIRCDDPVVIFEPKMLWSRKEEVPNEIVPGAIGKARIAREGRDVTVVTWSAPVPIVQAAARLAANEGVEAEILDLRSIWPWDEDAVATSLQRTRRLLVVHEAVIPAGFGAEIVARMVEQLGPARLTSVGRLGSPRVPVPFASPLEDAMRLTPERIALAIVSAARRATTPIDATQAAG